MMQSNAPPRTIGRRASSFVSLISMGSAWNRPFVRRERARGERMQAGNFQSIQDAMVIGIENDEVNEPNECCKCCQNACCCASVTKICTTLLGILGVVIVVAAGLIILWSLNNGVDLGLDHIFGEQESSPMPSFRGTPEPTIMKPLQSDKEVMLHALGDIKGDKYGVSVSLSNNGKRLAVGSRSNVHIYDFEKGDYLPPRVLDVSNGVLVAQKSSVAPIPSTDYFPVSISGDGNRVAVVRTIETEDPNNDEYNFHVSVYEIAVNEGRTSWTQLGLDIIETGDPFLRCSVSLSKTGSRVAIGAPGQSTETGRVFVYDFNAGADSGSWELVGTPIDGNARIGQHFGWSVSLSANGNTLAVGAPSESRKKKVGYVRVHQFDVNTDSAIGGVWSQVGSGPIFGTENFEKFGYSVSISSEGTVVAVGSPSYDANSGRTSVYELSQAEEGNGSSTWTQLGPILMDGDESNARAGSSVSLTSDGAMLLVGSPGHGSSNGDNGGYANVYQFEKTEKTWIQVNGFNIAVGLEGDSVGYSVSLSDNGVIAVGAPMIDTMERGYIMVHNKMPVLGEPVVKEPVAEEPVAEEPVAEEPVVEEPVAEEPVVCTVCQDGSDISDPGVFLEKINLSCRDLSLSAETYPIQYCSDVQEFSSLCGCDYTPP